MASSVLDGEDDPRSPDSFVMRGGRDLAAPCSERRPRSAGEVRTTPMTPQRAPDPPRRREGDSLAFGRAALHCFGHITGLDSGGDTTSAVGPFGERVIVVNLSSLTPASSAAAEGAMPATEAGFVLTKLDVSGLPRWTKRFTGSVHVESVAIDPRGEILLTGMLLGPAHFGGPKLASVGADAFVVKLDTLGNHRWSLRFGDSYSQGKGVAVDRKGNVFVTGVFFGTLDLGTGPIEARGALSMFVARFDAEGRAAWGKRFGGASLTMGLGLAAREPNRLSVACLCDGPVDFGGGPLLVPQGTAVVTVELDVMGNHLMSRRVGLLQTRLHG